MVGGSAAASSMAACMDPKKVFSKGFFSSRSTALSMESWRASIIRGFSPRAGVTTALIPGCLACDSDCVDEYNTHSYASLFDQGGNVLDDVASGSEEEGVTYHDLAASGDAVVKGVSDARRSELHVRWTHNPRLGSARRSVCLAYFFVPLVRFLPAAAVVDDDHADLLATERFAVLVRRDARIETIFAAARTNHRFLLMNAAGSDQESCRRKQEHHLLMVASRLLVLMPSSLEQPLLISGSYFSNFQCLGEKGFLCVAN